MKAFFFLPLLALPLLAAEVPLSSESMVCAQTHLDKLRTAYDDARRALESGTGNQVTFLNAERTYLFALHKYLPKLGLPEADAQEIQTRLVADLLKNATSSLMLAQRRFESGSADFSELLEARRVNISAQFTCKSKPHEALKEELLALSREAEAYWARQLEGAVADRLQVNREIIKLLSMQQSMFQLPVEERLLGLCEENVSILQQRYWNGLGSMAELSDAMDELEVQRHLLKRPAKAE